MQYLCLCSAWAEVSFEKVQCATGIIYECAKGIWKPKPFAERRKYMVKHKLFAERKKCRVSLIHILLPFLKNLGKHGIWRIWKLALGTNPNSPVQQILEIVMSHNFFYYVGNIWKIWTWSHTVIPKGDVTFMLFQWLMGEWVKGKMDIYVSVNSVIGELLVPKLVVCE